MPSAPWIITRDRRQGNSSHYQLYRLHSDTSCTKLNPMARKRSDDIPLEVWQYRRCSMSAVYDQAYHLGGATPPAWFRPVSVVGARSYISHAYAAAKFRFSVWHSWLVLWYNVGRPIAKHVSFSLFRYGYSGKGRYNGGILITWGLECHSIERTDDGSTSTSRMLRQRARRFRLGSGLVRYPVLEMQHPVRV